LGAVFFATLRWRWSGRQYVFCGSFFDGSLADDGYGVFPLLVGDEKKADVARGGCDGANAFGMLGLLFVADAGAGIDAVLDHEEAVIEQIVAKALSSTAFGFCLHR